MFLPNFRNRLGGDNARTSPADEILWTKEIMRLWILIALQLHITKVFPKKYVSSSDESIENLIYYQDCKHKAKETTPAPAPLRMETKKTQQPDCPFPKMCCSMSCGNDCGSTQSLLGRQMEPIQNKQSLQPMSTQPRLPLLPVQPQILQRGRKKKMKPQQNLISPIGGRRGAAFTKDKIKSLISHDQDIRKILKDLVRVTMQKVDLLELINPHVTTARSLDTSFNSEEEDVGPE